MATPEDIAAWQRGNFNTQIGDAEHRFARQQEITDRINTGWLMEYTYYHNPEGEDFRLIDLNHSQEDDIELTGEEWAWIRQNFSYRTEEECQPGITRVTYFFDTATEVAQ